MTDPDDTIPDNDPPECEVCGESDGHDPPRQLTTEERIAELEAEKRAASYGRAQEINGELEELYIRLQYEKTGKVAL